ncbi:chorismate-binding protein [Tistrella bauzanensis]|uniref:chorismate-binding protein n=1 Tax=Tistrella TaxID=171436 RepID=UPI0031F6243E
MRCLLIDNHDSFTGNLARLWWQVTGVLPVIVPHDAAHWRDLAGDGFRAVLISPGPGRPDTPADFRLGAEVLRAALVPGSRLAVLGICLGHQGLAIAAGGAVIRAGEPRHGRLSPVVHHGHRLLSGLASPFMAVRYHSLVAAEPVPDDLQVLARAGDDGAVMALGHRTAPVFGVQFHPESILTNDGARLLANFAGIAAGHGDPVSAEAGQVLPPSSGGGVSSAPEHRDWPAGMLPDPGPAGWQVLRRRVGEAVDIEAVADLACREGGWSLWLDAADGDPAARPVILAAQGPAARRLRYRVAARRLTVADGAGRLLGHVDGPVFDLLDDMARRIGRVAPVAGDDGAPLPGPGFYGYLGYELAEIATGVPHHASRHDDLRLILADRLLVAAPGPDGGHAIEAVMLVPAADPAAIAAAQAWADDWLARLAVARPLPAVDMTPIAHRVTARHGPDSYRRRIRAAQRLIRMGQSFEICLTRQMHVAGPVDAWTSYRRLRRMARAPLMAWLGFGDVSVLSASPELFLEVDMSGGRAIARPIKGTIGRGADPAADAAQIAMLAGSEKERAENLMIVDLMRNDLGRMARPDGVDVPVLFGIESFATLHQMVSTVRARLRPDATAIQVLAACFPGGSMTGAPKRRTLEIIARLEGGPRGIYSGAIGRIGLDGSMRLAMVIRTVVVDEDGASIGAGGAITHLSDPDGEVMEMALKARVPVAAVFPQRNGVS